MSKCTNCTKVSKLFNFCINCSLKPEFKNICLLYGCRNTTRLDDGTHNYMCSVHNAMADNFNRNYKSATTFLRRYYIVAELILQAHINIMIGK